MSNLKLIDFSDGIRSEEIQHNFNALQEEINRERKNVGGAGIASGLDLTVIVNDNDFAIKVSEASIIAVDGSEIHVEEQKIDIEPPKLSKEIEFLNANYDNQITLKHIPYALNRRVPVEYSNSYAPELSGIEIKYQNSENDDDYIRVRAISGRTLTLSGVTRRDVKITYRYSAKRIDTVYLDEDYNVKVISGITSSAPSITLPPKYKYLIAFIEIDATYTDDSNKMFANILIRSDLRKIRNLYTDKDGILWICGIPFDDLQIIHMIEPKNPKENTMWYDTYTNQLKVWKATDKLVYMNEYIVTTDFVNNPDIKKDFATDVYFYAGEDQLSVYINDVKLNSSQFDELHNGMVIDKLDIAKKIMTKYFRVYADLQIGDKVTYKVTNFDKHYMWVPVNHSSFVNAKETKLFGPTNEYENNNYFATEAALAMGQDESNYPYKYQYFFFDREKDLNMLFTPGKKELELLINQTPLHIDQFEEITINDLYDTMIPNSVLTAAQEYFNWDLASIEKYNGEFDNIGIGFKLNSPLDVALGHEENGAIDLYVEATVQRRVNDGPLKRKLQRTATFVNEYVYTVEDTSIMDIQIENGFYRYGENQLEVYHNGLKITNTIDYIEGTDLNDEPVYDEETGAIIIPPERSKGAISRQFTINNIALNLGDKITYRISTNIYSYDHINDLIEELDYNAMTAVLKVDELYDKTIQIQQDMETTVSDLQDELDEIKTIANNLDGKYLTKDSVIGEAQLPANILANTVQSLSHISSSIVYKAGTLNYDVKDFLRQEDFVFVIRRDSLSQLDKFMIRDVDYSIYNLEGQDGYETTTFSLTSEAASLMNNGDRLIFTGIKFGKAGR